MAESPLRVRAAGAVIVRTAENASLETLLIHRPKYDDWSIPKGKHEPGETDIECALREIHEETGLEVELGEIIAEVEYLDHRERPKTVIYFMAVHVGGDFVPNEEVDVAVWMDLAEARHRLSYTRDQAVLDAANSYIELQVPEAD